jgi:hypothetical protein
MKKKLKQISILVLITMMMAGMISSTVAAAPAGESVLIDVPETSKSGVPGSTVTYTITISNNELVDVDLKINAVSSGGWNKPVVVPDEFTLAVSDSQEVVVNVPIPVTATTGQNDVSIVKIEITVGADTLQETILLTTRVEEASTPVPGRPLIAISTYNYGTTALYAGSEFTLQVTLHNDGQTQANNVVITFNGTDFFPRETGGVRTAGAIGAGKSSTVSQKFLIGDALAWANIAPISAAVSYTDAAGTPYTETFTLSVVITEPSFSYSATATPNVPLRPQLVVTGYATDIDPLQPGSIFTLTLDIKNLGTADAKGVSAVIGGGVAGTEDPDAAQPGGIGGAQSDLSTFAPLGSSNVVFLGDINKDGVISISQQLVVNVTAAPGAYTLKLSFVYSDAKGDRQVDDQVITLLVYSLPQVEVSFYRDPGMFTAGMENMLPLQITNLGKKTYVLGNMKVTAENADVYNNVLMVGALDAGGYFTLDASLFPYQEGPLELKIEINYSDDFNQPRVIEQVIPIEIQPAMDIPPDMGGMNGEGNGSGVIDEPQPETFWQKVLRFFKGLFGLGSGVEEEPVYEEMPSEDIIVPVVPKG